MTISWTDAAIEAAIDAFYEGSDMRAALDAAVRTQGDLVVVPYKTFCETMWGVRADALEEAAKAAGECHFDEDDPKNDDRDRAYAQARRHAAADIRALKDNAPDDSNDGQPDEMQEWRDFDPDC